MVFVTTMALLAALYQLSTLYNDGNYVLVAIDVVIITPPSSSCSRRPRP